MPFLRIIFYVVILLSVFGCNTTTSNLHSFTVQEYYKNKENLEFSGWHHRDVIKDSIPGISTEKAHQFLKGKTADTIVVAIIDSELDIELEDLKNQIWINTKEVPNNNIDDDNNGYIDDINGWNYTGTNEGDSIPYVNYEFTRIIRKFDLIFKGVVSKDSISADLVSDFVLYQKAYAAYNKELNFREKRIASFKRMKNNFIKSKKVAQSFFSNEDYSIAKLDSLEAIITDKEIKKRIGHWKYFFENKIEIEAINTEIKRQKLIKDKGLSISFNDRYLTNDDSNDLTDFPYGNNNVQGTKKIDHATKIVSVLAANRHNGIGIDGIINTVKIMPLSISVAGNEFDKDIALAIKYAVDNGAKVINMSIGKDFSLHPIWVQEAIQYAEKNDVLIVTSAGNEGHNLDKIENYPSDSKNNLEFASNFIKVGGTSYKIDSTLIYRSSNYGKMEVDIFAPCIRITCLNRKEVTSDFGTSFAAPIVSGVAALIRSYYPDLSASEVKQIIMESGVSYDIMVNKPSTSKEKELVPFSSLSKSGKIVNAYNALLMAEEVSKKKK